MEAVSGGHRRREPGAGIETVVPGGGRRLACDLDGQIRNGLLFASGPKTILADVNLHARGQAVDFKQFDLAEYRVQVVRQNQSLAVVTGSGTYDAADRNLDLQLALQASCVALGQAVADARFTSGTAELQGRLTQKRDIWAITGKFLLTDLNGRAGPDRFINFGSRMDLDLSRTADQVQINKINGQLLGNGSAGGHFEIAGKADLARRTAQLTAGLSGFNQDGLGPFLEPLLADKKLVSLTVDGNADVQYDPEGTSAIKTSLQVANLVVSDPQRRFPAEPLEARLQVEADLNKQAADLRRFQITLTPTPRAQNQIQLQGQLDFSRTNATSGNLKLTADALDVTSYYDLFAGGKSESQPAAPPAGTTGNPEPPAIILPLKNFTVTADVRRLYLHEIEVADWQAKAEVNGGRVVLKPFQLTLNGAPVKGTLDLNLGVPGYRYDLAIGATRVPLAPLMDSFTGRKGQMGGSLTANIQARAPASPARVCSRTSPASSPSA